jgi:hypothetical protein
MNNEVPIKILKKSLDHVFLSMEKSWGGRKIVLETEKFYVKGECAEINWHLFVKPKSHLSRICLHSYEDSSLQRQTVNRNIISGPFNIELVIGKEIIILKVIDDV